MALETSEENGRGIRKTVTILRPVEELYEAWRDLERLPEFMDTVESVAVLEEGRTHWVVTAPGGRTVEWDAEIEADDPNERIAWRSLPGAEVENSGEVRFEPAPGERGTELRVTLWYHPAAGDAGAKVAKLFGEEPSRQLDEDLYRFKQLMEAGRIPTTEGQSHGNGAREEDV